jgi:glutaredoxin
MQLEDLSEEGYTVYTKSNCPYCTKVKKLLAFLTLQPKFINCDEYLVNSEVKEAFLTWIQSINGGISHRTFPMVFYQGKFIGGFTETEKFYAKENIFLEDLEF